MNLFKQKLFYGSLMIHHFSGKKLFVIFFPVKLTTLSHWSVVGREAMLLSLIKNLQRPSVISQRAHKRVTRDQAKHHCDSSRITALFLFERTLCWC